MLSISSSKKKCRKSLHIIIEQKTNRRLFTKHVVQLWISVLLPTAEVWKNKSNKTNSWKVHLEELGVGMGVKFNWRQEAKYTRRTL